MAAKATFVHVEIRTLTHATEDHEKVLTALRNIVPQDAFEHAKMRSETIEGYFGNQIISTTLNIQGKSFQRHIMQDLFRRLGEDQRQSIMNSLSTYVDDDGNFYLRLSKDMLYLGKISLGRENTLRLRAKLVLPRKRRELVIETLKQLMLDANSTSEVNHS